jgi:hypothetical protein
LASATAELIARARDAKDAWLADRQQPREIVEAAVARAAITHAKLLDELLVPGAPPFSWQDPTELAYRGLAARAYLIHTPPLPPGDRQGLSRLAQALGDPVTDIREAAETEGLGWALDAYEAWLGLPLDPGDDEGPTPFALTQVALEALSGD